MNEDNFRFLSENILPRLGFGDAFTDELRTALQRNDASFSLMAKTKDGMTYEPLFERNDSDERYYLNKVKVTYDTGKEPAIEHTFSLYRQRGHDVEEMANLMQGRSVYKTYVDGENVRQGRWTRLDFGEKNDQGNFVERRLSDQYLDFRLAKELSSLPLAPMNQSDKENLLTRLQKGYKEPVNIILGGSRERVTLEAAPHRQQITVTNGKGVEIPLKKKENRFEVGHVAKQGGTTTTQAQTTAQATAITAPKAKRTLHR